MTDTLTVLKSAGPKLTKIFDGDTVIPYDTAKNFTVESIAIQDIRYLSAQLIYLSKKPTCCIIRGEFIGEERARVVADQHGLELADGRYPRVNALFDDKPRHWRCDDIDSYEPMICDPVADPEGAIAELIATEYPPEFQDVSYHWQLSSSHGRKPGVLKCHIWWWIKTPYTGIQHKAWARANNMPIDVAPYRKVQVHYTATPIFTNGAVDPVAKRAALHRGKRDEVDLVIDAQLLEHAADETYLGDDIERVDPTAKPGLIGAFCRAYPISRVIEELLPDEFEFAVASDRRVTWLNSGGGAPEGCFITEQDDYLGNTHNSDPFDGRLANAWDLVRVFKFGDKDASLDADDRAMCSVSELPSHRAMVAWAREQEGVIEDATEVAVESSVSLREALAGKIASAPDEQTLRGAVALEIQQADLPPIDREVLVHAMKARLDSLLSAPSLIGDVRRMLARTAATREDDRDMPAWAKPWVFLTDKDRFFNLDTHESVSAQGFCMAFDRHAWPFLDGDRGITSAAQCCKLLWDIETVVGTMYVPWAAPVFEMFGVKWANSYSDKEIPAVPPVLTSKEEAAVALVEDHMALLYPDERERALLLSWVSHNVRFPGRKIRWAPFIPGQQGTGKTFLLTLLGHVMGSDNVAPLDANVICKSDFTGWSVGYCLRAIEEIKLHGVDAHDVVNKIKQFISNDAIDTHGKGKDSFKAMNTTNYMVFSNYLDGIVIEGDDRRYCSLPIALRAEKAKELTESGYFKLLFDAVARFPGALRKWLLEYPPHPDFDADGRAPMTSARAQVIELSKNFIEIAAEEIIEEGTAGVTKHVLSSSCLTAEIAARTGKDVRGRSVHKLLQNLGYTLFGGVKWREKNHTIWLGIKAPPMDTNMIRNELDAACAASEFLK